MQAFMDGDVQKGLVVQCGVQFDEPFIDMRPPPAATIALEAKPDFPHLVDIKRKRCVWNRIVILYAVRAIARHSAAVDVFT